MHFKVRCSEAFAFLAQKMYKPTSSRNDMLRWWSGESSVEMERQERQVAQKVQVKRNSLMQLPDCPVCWDGFDDGPRMPRLLHCGHTICQVRA